MGNLRADVFVIDGPKSMEAENILVIIAYVFHLIPILVSHTVINGFELDLWKETRQRVFCSRSWSVPGEKHATVVNFLN